MLKDEGYFRYHRININIGLVSPRQAPLLNQRSRRSANPEALVVGGGGGVLLSPSSLSPGAPGDLWRSNPTKSLWESEMEGKWCVVLVLALLAAAALVSADRGLKIGSSTESGGGGDEGGGVRTYLLQVVEFLWQPDESSYQHVWPVRERERDEIFF